MRRLWRITADENGGGVDITTFAELISKEGRAFFAPIKRAEIPRVIEWGLDTIACVTAALCPFDNCT